MLTLAEAAEQLGIAPSTLRHQARTGRLKARLMGKTYVVTEREVSRYRATSLGRPGRPSRRSGGPTIPRAGSTGQTRMEQLESGLGTEGSASRSFHQCVVVAQFAQALTKRR